MKVRVRIVRSAPAPTRSRRQAAGAAAAVLAPVSFGVYALGLWGLGSDLGVAGRFGIDRGVFSHWQVWIGMGVALTAAAVKLNRYANSGPAHT